MRIKLRDVAAFAIAAFAMVTLDAVWLGVVARGLYAEALGPLQRSHPFWPAVAAFYVSFVAGLFHFVLRTATSPGRAARQGALFGLCIYCAYDFTNWAVLRDWTPWIVPIDIAWGVVITAAAAWLAAFVRQSGRSPSAER